MKDKVKLIYQPGWQQPETVLELLISKDRWDTLYETDRGIIEGACRDTLKETLNDSASLQTEALDRRSRKTASGSSKCRRRCCPPSLGMGRGRPGRGRSDYFFKTVLHDIAKFGEAAQKESAPAPVQGSGAVGRNETQSLSGAATAAADKRGCWRALAHQRCPGKLSHRRIGHHRFRIGNPFVEIFLGPGEAFLAELLHARGIMAKPGPLPPSARRCC